MSQVEKFENVRITTKLYLQDYIDKLDTANNEFQKLMLARVQEKSELPKDRMIDIRREMGKCYVEIIARIEAVSILRPSPAVTAFIDKLNINIKYYNDVIAKRKGRKNKDETED